jgi:hypothetical protein
VIWAKHTFTLGRADYQRQRKPILYDWKEGSDHYWCGARDRVVNPDRMREGRSSGTADRARPEMRRRHHPALAGVDG